MRDIAKRIEDELARLDRMQKYSENARKDIDGISEEIRKAQKKLDLLLRNARSASTALNVELHDEAIEATSPLCLPSGSLEAAVRAPSSGGEAA